MTPASSTTAAWAAAAITLPPAPAAEPSPWDRLIEELQSSDASVRAAAWQKAARHGAATVKPMGELLTHPNLETARAAGRGLFQIVRHAGRPGADQERREAAAELVTLLQGPTPVRRQILWMLSEIGGDESVASIAALLSDQEVREDARAALERIPGRKALAALRTALKSAPQEYRAAVAQSLRVRGVEVSGYPSEKLLPSRPPASRPAS